MKENSRDLVSVPPTGGGNRGPGPQWHEGALTSAELFHGSLFHPSLASLRGPFRCIVDFKSALLASATDANFKNAHFILRDYCAAAD